MKIGRFLSLAVLAIIAGTVAVQLSAAVPRDPYYLVPPDGWRTTSRTTFQDQSAAGWSFSPDEKLFVSVLVDGQNNQSVTKSTDMEAPQNDYREWWLETGLVRRRVTKCDGFYVMMATVVFPGVVWNVESQHAVISAKDSKEAGQFFDDCLRKLVKANPSRGLAPKHP